VQTAGRASSHLNRSGAKSTGLPDLPEVELLGLRLFASCQLLSFVQPCVGPPDHFFAGRNSVGEDGLEKSVAVNASGASATGRDASSGAATATCVLPLRCLSSGAAAGGAATVPVAAPCASALSALRGTSYAMGTIAVGS
jgi:hypothetical protein